MTVDSELERWSQSWHRNKTPNVDRLIKNTEARERRKHLMVAAELLASAVAVWQVIRFLNVTMEPALHAWAWSLLALLIVSQIVFLAMRRALWSTQGSSVTQLLEQSLRHAVFGMRYALVNGVAFTLVGISLIPFVLESWSAIDTDPARVRGFIVSVAANGAVLVGGAMLNAWYWLKQRARHREIISVLRSISQ